MKHLLGRILYLSFLFLLLCEGMDVYCQTDNLNSIEYEKVIVSGVRLGSSLKKLTGAIGKPDTVIQKMNEFEGTNYLKYIYGQSSIYVSNNKFVGFEIKDESLSFDYGQIKVGDKIEILKVPFLESYNNRFSGEGNIIIKVRIGNSDSYVLFICHNNVVVEIMIWNDL